MNRPDSPRAAAPAAPPRALFDPATFTPEQSVMLQLKRALVGLSQATTRDLALEDSSLPQWLPLYKVSRGDADTVVDLARQCYIDVSTMTRLLDRLEKKALLRRERSTTDRRVVHIVLTPAGRALAGRLPAVLCGVYNRALAGFSAGEWAQLQTLLSRLVANAESLGAAGRADA